MPKSAKSASLSARSKPKGSAVGRRLIAGLNEALAHARGDIELPSYTVTVPDDIDVAKLRHRLGLSQRGFARAFGLDVTAIHAWEQGRRRVSISPTAPRASCSPSSPRSPKRCGAHSARHRGDRRRCDGSHASGAGQRLSCFRYSIL